MAEPAPEIYCLRPSHKVASAADPKGSFFYFVFIDGDKASKFTDEIKFYLPHMEMKLSSISTIEELKKACKKSSSQVMVNPLLSISASREEFGNNPDEPTFLIEIRPEVIGESSGNIV